MYSAPPISTSVDPATPTSENICGIVITPTQPTATYASTVTHLGAWSQTKLSTSPSAAPPHTVASTTQRSFPENASSANGVYVPAMKRKIVEWSSRRAHRRRAADLNG